MDSLNIIQPSSFIFFILVISIWYIIVEIIGWDNYIFRKSLNRYHWSNTIDRLIHYVAIGILFHFFVILLMALIWNLGFLDQILLTGYKFSENIKFTDGNNHFETLISAQLIVSALMYFIFIIILFFSLKIWFVLLNVVALVYQRIRMKRRNKIHKKNWDQGS